MQFLHLCVASISLHISIFPLFDERSRYHIEDATLLLVDDENCVDCSSFARIDQEKEDDQIFESSHQRQ